MKCKRTLPTSKSFFKKFEPSRHERTVVPPRVLALISKAPDVQRHNQTAVAHGC